MATYALGDIQGCFASFQRLLARMDFDPRRDQLWLVGDLVNRGPESLAVLRWVLAHESCVTTVLGNHDLHLLAVHAGHRKLASKDTLQPILNAPDRDELLDWLRRQPLLHHEQSTLLGRWIMVHAGLLPSWDEDSAIAHARELETTLRARDGTAALYAPGQLAQWTAVFTRIRTCSASGQLCEDFKGPPATAPEGFRPWFEHPHSRAPETTVVFGHWAALGLHRAPGVLGLDSGCVWGASLSAVCLDDGRLIQVPSVDQLA